eukprot:Phypoly_transcript_09942.p1 GENE.Phypoly_transcript_09942~~Phypoly_transcript_09942.p1  ORF type:complete len:374 (+),score=41.04 Phypoly_transcript_09942:109-1230(+)
MQTNPNLLSASCSYAPATKDKTKKKSVMHRILTRWTKSNKLNVVEEDSNLTLKRFASSKSFKRRMPVKLIILGTENSGKSTIAKQIKTTYQGEYSEDEKKEMLLNIRSYILGNIKDILQGIDKFNLPLSPEIKQKALHITSLPKTHPWNEELVDMLKTLLLDSVVSMFISKCAELQIYDNFPSLLPKLDDYGTPDYIPTNEDILKFYTRTIGVRDISYKLNGLDYRVQDLGGSKNEQRKWIFFFENVQAVVFVVALNEYDLQLREEPTINRMHESLRLFSNTINHIYFRQTPVILLLNKTDLFSEKIRRSPLNTCFPDYTGGADFDSAVKFIETKFRALDGSTDRKIFAYTTCAMSNIYMQNVFEEVMQNVVA